MVCHYQRFIQMARRRHAQFSNKYFHQNQSVKNNRDRAAQKMYRLWTKTECEFLLTMDDTTVMLCL